MKHKVIYTSSTELATITLPGSKSISNRLLIAQALATENIELEYLSEAKDTRLLLEALTSNSNRVNVGMAGTAFRFLTAYYATLQGTRVLTGAERMKKRPIQILVEKLVELGADVTYLEKDGFPPLTIKGKPLDGGDLSIDATVSSQYVSALLLIAPYLNNGLNLKLVGDVVSFPYIDLTIGLQQQLGIDVSRNGSEVKVAQGEYKSAQPLAVESDWSSAAFFYQAVAFTGRPLLISNLKEFSKQGDAACAQIFTHFRVVTEFTEQGALLTKQEGYQVQSDLVLDLTKTPDLIPSVAISASQLTSKITIKGTKTLYIKECNRVEALKIELKKVGAELIELDGNSFEINAVSKELKLSKELSFETYNDHRMAMALAPLAFLFNSVIIEKPEVVEKSFPSYWLEIAKVGINVVS